MKKRILFVLPVTLLLGLSACKFNNATPPHEHTYVPHEEVEATCHSTGIEFYYTCEECDKIFDGAKNEIDAPIVIPIDVNAHDGTKVLVASGNYKTSYKVGESFDLAGLMLTMKCENCEGTVLSQSQMSKVGISYPTEGENKFVTADLQNKNHIFKNKMVY